MCSRRFRALSALLLASAAAYSQQQTRNLEAERRTSLKLQMMAPGAVEIFHRATEAMRRGDCRQAIPLFGEVEKQAPAFSTAPLRAGLCLARLGQTGDALILLQKAVKIERTPDNLIALSRTLAYPAPGKQGTREQQETALALAQEAAGKYEGSGNSGDAVFLARLALALRKPAEFRQATETLLRKYPDLAAAHYLNAIRLALDHSWSDAKDEIRKAERLGLPAPVVNGFLARLNPVGASPWSRWYYVFYLFGAWACGLLLLFVAGKLFSRLTLHFIESADPNVPPRGAEVALRRSYRRLIDAAGAYYYLSIPFVILLTLGTAASIIYAFLESGRMPIGYILLLVISAIVTVYVMIRSLFIRVSPEQPGRGLGLDEAPGLWRLICEVAQKLGTRPLDEIRITPGTEMAVFEQGTYRERRQDMGRRTLVMGVGLLPGFGQNAFRAVLAHEYGHLSHRDTAGGDVALRVNQDMMKFGCAMAFTGQNVWWNIGFGFLRLYDYLFRRISYGATRLQEVLADRASVQIFGAQAFEEGLRHVIRRNIEFNFIAREEIAASLASGRHIRNLYALQVQHQENLAYEVDQEVNHQTSEDDTHPSPADRFRLVSRLACKTRLAPSGPIWDLFADRDAITAEMSSEVERLAREAIAEESNEVTPAGL